MNPINIADRRELFVDRHLIDRLDNARLVLHHPQPQEVALNFDASWEGAAPGYPTVFCDGGVYRLYYRARPPGFGADDDERQLTCYAESDDGIRWRKPELGLFEAQGSKQNNIVWKGVMAHNLTPFRDENPDCPADRRYKAVGGVQLGSAGLWALGSPDGIAWRKLDDKPLPMTGSFDSQNLMFWDATVGLYRAYWRAWRMNDPKVPTGRDVLTATSPDFMRWSAPQWLDYEPNRSGSTERDEDEHGDHHQYYCGGVIPYYRAPHLILGFPQRYMDRGWTASTDELPERQRRRELAAMGIGGGWPTRLGTAITDVLFMASRDGQRFFVWPEAFVRPGIQRPGSWYYGGTGCTWGLVETASPFEGAPPELSFYIAEGVQRDGPGRLRRHTLRLDGFASVYAPLTGGSLTTNPLQFTGSRLELNFSTSAGGRLRVEIQDEHGKPIPGFALGDCHLLYGDQLDRIVLWQGGADVGALAARSVRLRFELKDADIFALQFRNHI